MVWLYNLLQLLGTKLLLLLWWEHRAPSGRLVIRMALVIQGSWYVWDVAIVLITHIRHGVSLVVHVHRVHGVVPRVISRPVTHVLILHAVRIWVTIRLMQRRIRDEWIILDILTWRWSEVTSRVQTRIMVLWCCVSARQRVGTWSCWHCSNIS